MTTWGMRIACWIHKVTNTHSEYVILIALPLQQQLHERASLLSYTPIDLIVVFLPYVCVSDIDRDIDTADRI
jgi:hypothetical protein